MKVTEALRHPKVVLLALVYFLAVTGSYGIEQWNYKYAKEYGSKEYSARITDTVGHDAVEVQSAKLEDARTVFLQIADFRPVHQMAIRYNLTAADGQNVRGELFPTIHWAE